MMQTTHSIVDKQASLSPMKKNQSLLLQQSQLDIKSELEKEKEAERAEIKKYGVSDHLLS